jgi:hypothetical protein
MQFILHLANTTLPGKFGSFVLNTMICSVFVSGNFKKLRVQNAFRQERLVGSTIGAKSPNLRPGNLQNHGLNTEVAHDTPEQAFH